MLRHLEMNDKEPKRKFLFGAVFKKWLRRHLLLARAVILTLPSPLRKQGSSPRAARNTEAVRLSRNGEAVRLSRNGEAVRLSRNGEAVRLSRNGEAVRLSRNGEAVRLSRNARRKPPFGWAASAQRTKSVLHCAFRKPSGFLLAQE